MGPHRRHGFTRNDVLTPRTVVCALTDIRIAVIDVPLIYGVLLWQPARADGDCLTAR